MSRIVVLAMFSLMIKHEEDIICQYVQEFLVFYSSFFNKVVIFACIGMQEKQIKLRNENGTFLANSIFCSICQT